MNNKDFQKILNKTITKCVNTLTSKAKEYAADEDRLHNFKIAATLQGCLKEQALGGMMSKHIVSIYDMINTFKEYPLETWDEKIGDAINYLILLRAVVEEEKRETTCQ